MILKDKAWLIIAFILIFIVSIAPVNAIGISVTKAFLEYNNVLQGGYAEDSFYVSTDAPFNVPISYELTGEIADWINITPDLNDPNNTVNINNSNYQQLRVVINPPADIPLGRYTGTLRIITGTLDTMGGQYGSQLQAAFMIRVTVDVTGTEFLSCSGSGMVLRDSEIGSPIEYYMSVANSGNIRIRPTATVDIWNQDQTKLIDTVELDFNSMEVFPTTNQAFAKTFFNDLRIGQYWAYVTVHPCENSALTTFNIYEKGSIVDSGEFLRLDNGAWAGIGDVVPITAVFKNTGSRTVSAKFKGVVTMDNRIVETLDSEYLDIAPGQIGNMQVFFTPKKHGQYIISGRVLYNNKLSFEKSTVLNVNTGVEKNFSWIYILILIIIIIIILLLLIRIKKKKKEKDSMHSMNGQYGNQYGHPYNHGRGPHEQHGGMHNNNYNQHDNPYNRKY